MLHIAKFRYLMEYHYDHNFLHAISIVVRLLLDCSLLHNYSRRGLYVLLLEISKTYIKMLEFLLEIIFVMFVNVCFDRQTYIDYFVVSELSEFSNRGS
jgi:hypothetical protein